MARRSFHLFVFSCGLVCGLAQGELRAAAAERHDLRRFRHGVVLVLAGKKGSLILPNGDTLTFEFPVANLSSWHARVAELEVLAPTNPFAVLVLAQLECRATEPDATRLASKLKLARALEKWNHGS